MCRGGGKEGLPRARPANKVVIKAVNMRIKKKEWVSLRCAFLKLSIYVMTLVGFFFFFFFCQLQGGGWRCCDRVRVYGYLTNIIFVYLK